MVQFQGMGPLNLNTRPFSAAPMLRANKRLTLEGKRVLFRSTGKPQLANSLDDLATLSTAAQQAQRYVNTSKTGAYVATTGFGALLFAEPLTALATALTGNVLARFLARPVTAKAIRDWSKSYNKFARWDDLGSRNFYLQSSKVLAEAMAAEANAPELIPQITQELEDVSPKKITQREIEDFHNIEDRGGETGAYH